MSTLIRLIKFNISYYIMPRFESKKERNKFILMLLFMAVCFLMPAAMMIFAVYQGTALAIQNGVLAELISVIFFSAQIMVIVLGLTNYINMMYFSKDNNLLLAMPIKGTHIYIAKMVVCLISMMLLSATIVVPTFVTVAVAMAHAGVMPSALYYIGGLFAIVYVPLLPLLFVGILAFPIMKVVAFLKKKPLLMSITYTLFTILIIVGIWDMMFSLEMNSTDEIALGALIEQMSRIGKFSLSTLVLTRIMVGVDVGVNSGILVGILIGLVIINILLSMLLYRKTLSGLGEGGFDKTKKKSDVVTKANGRRTALLMREVKMVLRSPDLTVQTLMMMILSPVMIVVFALIPNEGIEGNPALFMSAMVYFYISIFGGLNYLASIGVSREGDGLSVLKFMPINSRDIVSIKLFLSDIVTVITCLLACIAYAICVDVPWYFAILMLIATSIMGASLNSYSLYRDVKKPNLKWMNIRDITKKNFGAIIPMLISMVQGMFITIITGVISFTPVDFGVQYAIFWALIFVCDVVFYFIFRYGKMAKMVKYYDDIEM